MGPSKKQRKQAALSKALDELHRRMIQECGQCISRDDLKKLTDAGLVAGPDPSFPKNHVAWPCGYSVVKPSTVTGNAIADLVSTVRHESGDFDSDAPHLILYRLDESWFCHVSYGALVSRSQDTIGPLPSIDVAIEHCLDFFFNAKSERFLDWRRLNSNFRYELEVKETTSEEKTRGQPHP